MIFIKIIREALVIHLDVNITLNFYLLITLFILATGLERQFRAVAHPLPVKLRSGMSYTIAITSLSLSKIEFLFWTSNQ